MPGRRTARQYSVGRGPVEQLSEIAPPTGAFSFGPAPGASRLSVSGSPCPAARVTAGRTWPHPLTAWRDGRSIARRGYPMLTNSVLRRRLAAILLQSVVLAVSDVALAASPASGQQAGVAITYLYDNTAAVPGVREDWGFACLVEGHGKRVLFDTGTKPEVLRHNAIALRVDLGRLDALVFSHDHNDHVGALPALGPRPGLPLFYAQGFNSKVVEAFRATGARLVPVSTSAEVAPGFRTSDEFGTAIKEEALLVDSSDGLVVIVGCSHPGIVSMLTAVKASARRPIHLVVGGFHLVRTPANEVREIIAALKALGVGRVGPTHCTGPEAIALFKEAFGDRYVPGGVGTVVTVR